MSIIFNDIGGDPTVRFFLAATSDDIGKFFPVSHDIFKDRNTFFLIEKDDFDKNIDKFEALGFKKIKRWHGLEIHEDVISEYSNQRNISLIPIINAEEWYKALLALQRLNIFSCGGINEIKENSIETNFILWKHFFFLGRFHSGISHLFPGSVTE